MFNSKKKQNCDKPIRFMYIGSVLPDSPQYDTKAFSRAGSIWQENLLTEMSTSKEVQLDEVISYIALESFPRSNRLFVSEENVKSKNDLKIKLISFINFTPLKQISIGMNSFFQILKWGLKTFDTKKNSRFVFLYNLSVPSVLFIYFATRLVNVKLVASINDIDVPGNTIPKSFFRRLDHKIQVSFIPKLDGHIVVSDDIMRDFAPSSKYVRIEGGVDLEAISYCEKIKKLNYYLNKKNKSSFKIVSFGSLEEINGFKVLINAFKILRKSGIDNVELIIAGKGSLRSFIETASQEDSAIKYLGYLNHEEVLTQYATADLLVNLRLVKNFDSNYFFPSKLLEYLSSGTAVVTTRVGSMSTELHDSVYFFEDESPEHVADTLIKLTRIDFIELNRVGNNALTFVKQNKTWGKQAEKVIEYIKAHVFDAS